jgi:hypothetical protein
MPDAVGMLMKHVAAPGLLCCSCGWAGIALPGVVAVALRKELLLLLLKVAPC